MCTWDERQMVPLAIESTKDFVDEFVVVDKGSRDGTVDAIKECAERWDLDIRVYVEPSLILRFARLFAIGKTDADWVILQEGDEVFHTDGPNSVFGLKRFLDGRNAVYRAPQTYLAGDLLHTCKHIDPLHVCEQLSRQPPHRFLYQNNGTIRLCKNKHGFERLPGDDDIPDVDGPEVTLPLIYKFNCNVKSPRKLFLRQFWFDWCKTSDAWRDCDLEEYVKRRLGVDDLEQATRSWYLKFWEGLERYDENRFGYYPKVIRGYIERGLIRGAVYNGA